MSLKPIHTVFSLKFNGLARELATEATIIDPITKNSFKVKKAIWDTGATASVINVEIAKQMGLVATGQTNVHTANGMKVSNTYVVQLQLIKDSLIVTDLNITEGNLGPHTDMLIGMDVIAGGDFIIENEAGKTHFSYCYPPLQNKYNIYQKANTINFLNNKHNAKVRR